MVNSSEQEPDTTHKGAEKSIFFKVTVNLAWARVCVFMCVYRIYNYFTYAHTYTLYKYLYIYTRNFSDSLSVCGIVPAFVKFWYSVILFGVMSLKKSSVIFEY